MQAFALDPDSGLTSAPSPAVSVTIDTVAPTAPTVAPDLLSDSDKGISSTDNITNDNTPTFSGPTAANNIVRLRVGASQVGIDTTTTDGTYSITTATLGDASRNFTMTFEDVAGNVTAISPALAVT